MLRPVALLPLLPLLAAPAMGQSEARTPQVRATLVPETRAIQPGTPLRLAIRLSIAPGWHIYWTNPGESGLPTTVRWSGPAGFRAATTRWPYPTRKEVFGTVTHVYEKEVVLLADVYPPADLQPGGSAEITAMVGWGACREVCVPEEVRLAVRLPVREAAPRPNPGWRTLAAAEAHLAHSLPEWSVVARRTGGAIALRLTPPPGAPLPGGPLHFFPEEPPLAAASVSILPRLADGALDLRIDTADPRASACTRIRGVLVALDGPGFANGMRALWVDAPMSGASAWEGTP